MRTLEFRIAAPELTESLTRFFDDIAAPGAADGFHPHALDAATARSLCHYAGGDLYYVILDGGRVIGYGMLRGWDEGFDVPSLGIAIHPTARGMGIGRILMEVLHTAARLRGASQVRLKVYPDNTAALGLYRSLGYEFGPQEEGQLVGLLELR